MWQSKVIIHIGLQKTASTYLQNVVFPKIKNVTYIGSPYTRYNYAFNSLQYADKSLYEASALPEEIFRIENEEAKGKPILISEELFSGYAFYNFINRGIIAERLSQAIPNAEIILFLRGQFDLIMSLYNQYVKAGWLYQDLDESFLQRPGKGFSLEQWLRGERTANVNNMFINPRSIFTTEHFQYSKLYSLYSDLFSKVHVFLYEDMKKDPEACLRRLASILSAELPADLEFESKTITNSGLSDYQLRERLLLNRLSLAKLSHIKAMRGFVKLLASFAPDRKDSNAAHVMSLLRECDIFSDNRLLNQRLNLGMQNYPKQYFGNDC